MRYAYYARLSKADQAVYRRSDSIADVSLRRPQHLHPIIARIARNLSRENRRAVAADARALCLGLATDVGAPPVTVKVLASRPSRDWGELHGLYEPVEARRRAQVTVWMRTAQQKRVVAFRTFLRTLLHEMCHHFDYEVFALDDSFHTEGFFKRESNLFKQLVPRKPLRNDASQSR